MDTLLDEGCKLFGRDAELVQLFNGILPPGYRMETHKNYTAVFTPEGGWTKHAGRKKVPHPVIPSSSWSA